MTDTVDTNKRNKTRGETLVLIELLAKRLAWNISKVVDELKSLSSKSDLSYISDDELHATALKLKKKIEA